MKLKPVKFAEIAGVSKAAISHKIKKNELVVDKAGYLDTDNPVNAQYISAPSRRGPRPSALTPRTPARAASIATTAPLNTPVALLTTDSEIAKAAQSPAELLNLTLREIVTKYGGIYNLGQHAKILRELTTTEEKNQKMAERGRRLIDKDFVTFHVFQFINILMKQLLDYPDSAVDNLISKVMSDGPDARDFVIAFLRDGLTRIISGSKERIINELKTLHDRYDTEEAEALGNT
jgi:hypothetical protein